MSYKLTDKNALGTLLQIEKKMTKSPLYHTLDEAEFEKYMAESQVFLLYLNKKVAGYCSFEIVNKELAEINGMAILEQFRRKGLGAYAIQLLLDKLKNLKTIMLVTHPENNKSLRLYLKFGFVIKEWKDNFFNDEPRLVLYRTN